MLWVSHRHLSTHESIERMFPDHLHVLKMLDSNVLIYGPEGAGKRCFLQKYLNGKFKCCAWTNVSHDCLNTVDRKATLEIMTRKSRYHVELRALDFGNNNKNLVKYVVKGFCEQLILDDDGIPTTFTIVIYGVEHISDDALSILNVYISKYTHIRFILVANRIRSVLIASVRFPRPSLEYVQGYIRSLCKHADKTNSEHQVASIYEKHNGHMSKCIMEYELLGMGISNQYEVVIQQIVEEYKKKIPSLKLVRTLYYQLLVNNFLVKSIIIDILKLITPNVLSPCVLDSIIHYASIYEHHSRVGERSIYHLDAFGCAIILCLKS